MIPALAQGVLPEGIWDCTLDEIDATFATTPARQEHLKRLQLFLRKIDQLPRVPLLIDGSFVIDKPRPKDIDICADLSALDDTDRRPWEDFFFGQKWYLEKDGIDFWIRSPAFCGDVSADEFPRIKAEDAERLGLTPGTRKGFLRLP